MFRLAKHNKSQNLELNVKFLFQCEIGKSIFQEFEVPRHQIERKIIYINYFTVG